MIIPDGIIAKSPSFRRIEPAGRGLWAHGIRPTGHTVSCGVRVPQHAVAPCVDQLLGEVMGVEVNSVYLTSRRVTH